MIIQNNVYLCYALFTISIMENIKNTASPASFVSPLMAAPHGSTSRILMDKATGDAPLLNAMKEEIFVSIKGYEGSYEISNYGKVRSLTKSWIGNNNLVVRKGKILKPSIDRFGYYKINLWGHCKVKRFLVSRLVALAFIPNPLNLPQVNHKDGKKLNNYEGNLEWVTGSENIQHAFDNGLINVSKGEDHCHAKLTEKDIHKIYCYLEEGYNYGQIAVEFGICKGSIQKVVEGMSWKHVGIDFSKFLRKPPSSKYKCVYYSPSSRNKQWAVRTKIGGKDKFLGYFNSEIEAYNAYKNYVEINHLKDKRER